MTTADFPAADAGWTLCVDFGTAFSKAAAAPRRAWRQFDPAMVRPLTLNGVAGDGNPFLLDSAIFVDADRILFGAAAVRRAEELEHKKRQALRSFKTLLSASDLERALNTSATLSIDPHRIFRMRDLIILYLAFLSRAIERAVAADPVLARASGPIHRRYAAPAWREGEGANLHHVVVRLFGEAETAQRLLGDALFSDEGISIASARDALASASAMPASGEWQMGMIFEATAAAAYSSIGLDAEATHFIVIDMGAGTTDVAAVARDATDLSELSGARVTLTRAGDFIDKILLNLAIDNNAIKTQADRAELWRTLMRSIRDVKESLFAEKRAAIRHGQRTIVINLRDLERDKDFKQFAKSIALAYEHGLDIVVARAAKDGKTQVHAIAVGGGAAAPFIQELIRRKPSRAGKVKIMPRPATPEWAHAPAFGGNLAPIFPQLAIAIGGALAPETMLARTSEAGEALRPAV